MPLRSISRSLPFLLVTALAACGGGNGDTGTGTTSSTGTGSGGAGGGAGGSAPKAVCTWPTQWTPPPACGSGTYGWHSLISDPQSPDFDAALAQKAERLDRQFHALNAHGTGMNSDIVVPLDDMAGRMEIESFLTMTDGWDFEAYSGMKVTDVITGWQQVAGAYAGPGAAADAFRYGTLRDQGAPCDDVDRARQHVLAALDALHLATAITGIPGGIARGFARVDQPGDGTSMTTPLFDSMGNPLPAQKNNGTWRADNSGGKFPDYIWIDACSRDMLLGWAIGYAGIWEVIRLDPSFDDTLKKRMQADAAAIARGLMKVGDSGYDLEIHDPDGRVTMFGLLNENAIDTGYLKGAHNGSLAIMALGVVGALSFVAEDPAIEDYLYDQLIGARQLDTMSRDDMLGVNIGVMENFSNDNMAFDAFWLAARYLCLDAPRQVIQAGAAKEYGQPGAAGLPVEQGQTWYDFVYAASTAGATSEANLGTVDEAAVQRGLTTLDQFSDAPAWENPRTNCDDQETQSGLCTADDGTVLHLLGFEGRGNKLVSQEPVPMGTRPASNYYWRTNPYEVNGGGDGSRLLPSNDFRVTYWMGRWLRR